MQRPNLDPALRPLIGQGRNAGQQRPLNVVYLDRLTATTAAAAVLNRNGFSIIDIDINAARPTITVENDGRTRELVASGQARDNGSGSDNGSRWRGWRTEIGTCLIVWQERGH